MSSYVSQLSFAQQLGTTPPTTPTRQAEFRANRATLRLLVTNLTTTTSTVGTTTQATTKVEVDERTGRRRQCILGQSALDSTSYWWIDVDSDSRPSRPYLSVLQRLDDSDICEYGYEFVSGLFQKCRNGKKLRKNSVAYLKSLYRDLVTSSCWVAATTMKEKADGTAAKATVKRLKAEIKRLQKVSGTGTSGTPKQLICYHCGEPGHVKPQCPNLDLPKRTADSKSSTAASDQDWELCGAMTKEKVGTLKCEKVQEGRVVVWTHSYVEYLEEPASKRSKPCTIP